MALTLSAGVGLALAAVEPDLRAVRVADAQADALGLELGIRDAVRLAVEHSETEEHPLKEGLAVGVIEIDEDGVEDKDWHDVAQPLVETERLGLDDALRDASALLLLLGQRVALLHAVLVAVGGRDALLHCDTE